MFFELQLDQQIAFLTDLKLESLPQISVGKLTDELNSLKNQIDEVKDRLNQLPDVDEASETPQPDGGSDDLPIEGPVTPEPDDDDGPSKTDTAER